MLPARLPRSLLSTGVGSGAWVPAWPANRLTPARAVLRIDLPAGAQVFSGTHQRCRPDLPGLGKRPGFHRSGGQRVRAIPQPQKGMALTIVETRAITGGVDTHADVHVAAALDPIGGLLGVREFPATAAGYGRLLGWLGGFGTVCLAGIEGTGSYGAGLARHVTAAGVRVVEVDRSDRQDRRRQGKSDSLDAVSAARAAQSGRARGASRGRDGAVEAIRALMVAKRSAAGERTQTINQARALVLTGPDDLRARFTGHTAAALVAELASLRPRPGSTVGYATPSRYASWAAARSSSMASSSASTSSSAPSSPPVPPGCSPSTGSAPTPRRCCSSQPGTTRNGCAARPPGRTCAAPPPSRHPRARPSAAGSTLAATARPATPCGGSCSPA